MKKREREKETYTVWSDYAYAFRCLREKEGVGAFAVCIGNTAAGIFLPFLEAALAGAVMACLMSGKEPGIILLLVAGYVVLLRAVQFLSAYLDEVQSKVLMAFRIGMSNDFYRKCVELDGQYIESAEGQKKMAQARENLFSGEDSGIGMYVNLFWHVVRNLAGLLIYAVIVGMANPLLLVILILETVFFEMWEKTVRKKVYGFIKENAKNRQHFRYLRRESISIENGKDIRIYRMDKWLLRAFHEVVDKIVKLEYKTGRLPMISGILDGVVFFFVSLLIYSYLIFLMSKGEITLPVFLLYIGIVSGFDNWIKSLFMVVQNIYQNKGPMDRFREFMDLEPAEGTGTDLPEHPGSPHEIRLEHVSFRYHGSDKDTIHDLSLTIPAGEKLALVGLNGAGKTTLTKLLCGIYRPTGGKIYLDGQDIRSLSQKEYFKEYAVVFQDVFAFSFSLTENVTCLRAGLEDEGRLSESLRKAGLSERVGELPKGWHTSMNKDLDREGISLSGGQLQKLMLARALYRDSPIVILDEPTAALDPIAESEMYEKYDEMICGKTSIFISHRLSSTRFCDRILYMENGQVAEEGSHADLMERQGAYAQLFALQAQYYQKKEEREDA